jgi:hypothetical protein
MASQASNPFLSKPDDAEVVEDPRLTARRARLRRVVYAIVGPAAVGTVVLLVVHVVKRVHAAAPAVTQEIVTAPTASAPVPIASSVASAAAEPSAASARAEPSAVPDAPPAESVASARIAPARVHGAARAPSTGPKQKRAWTFKK